MSIEAPPAAQAGTDEAVVLPWWQSRLNLAAVALAIAVLAGGLGWLVGHNGAIPNANSVDVGFMQDMRAHHDQAIELSFEYLALNDTDARLRGLAREIIVGQGAEIGRMVQLLKGFGVAEANETDTAMAWMGHAVALDQMPGLATQAELDTLLTMSGRAADEMFVALMAAHHEGGIHMAEYAAQHAGVSDVRAMAAAMADGQREEIIELQGLLSN